MARCHATTATANGWATLRIGRMPQAKKATLKQMLSADVDAALAQRPDLEVVKLADGAHDNWSYRAAETAASEALASQKYAWESVYNQITEYALTSVNSAEEARKSAIGASSRANEAAEALQSASDNIADTLGFQSSEEAVRAIIESLEIQSVLEQVSRIRVGSCEEIDGQCGVGMHNKPTYYFDRVRFSCPDNRPLLRGIHFERCEQGTPEEGLLVQGKCCSLSLGNEE